MRLVRIDAHVELPIRELELLHQAERVLEMHVVVSRAVDHEEATLE